MAEIINGRLVTHPRPALKHTLVNPSPGDELVGFRFPGTVYLSRPPSHRSRYRGQIYSLDHIPITAHRSQAPPLDYHLPLPDLRIRIYRERS